MKEKKDHFIRRIFITGIVAMLPLAVTVYVLKILYGLIVSSLMPFIAKIADMKNVEISESLLEIFTVIIFLLIIFLVGILTRLYVGKFFFNIMEKTIGSIPLANSIYNAIKQMIESFKSSSNSFQKVVLVNFPSDKAYCLGFVVKNSQPLIEKALGCESYNVFIPTAPNPTSGFVAVFPVDKCLELDATVEEGVKFILSAGIVNFKNDEEAKKLISAQ